MTEETGRATEPSPELVAALCQAGLIADSANTRFEPLKGGVSSDIWKVSTPERSFCVKRALSKLKVAADWEAPVDRNRFEVAWYQVAHEIVPEAVPEILFHDPAQMLCAMQYLEPDRHRLWKTELMEGRISVDDAAAVGERLGRIHAASANNDKVAALFPPNDIFRAIRLEPYLEATAIVHPDLRDQLLSLSERTAALRTAMVHGDVSPKNILLGPNGPVFLDAECACMGDPAFDLAFCLNHLLLKSVWNPAGRQAYGACFTALEKAYLQQVNWEPVDEIEQRAASLLPALMLARVDGKSPVEYIDTDQQREHVRNCARPLIKDRPARLDQVLDACNRELEV